MGGRLDFDPNQHDAHVRAFFNFWTLQLDRKVYSLIRKAERLNDDEWDRKYGEQNA